MRLIHVFVDNASYHKADIVKEWLAAAGREIVLHFLPPYCPHLDPIERLWVLMQENVTHNPPGQRLAVASEAKATSGSFATSHPPPSATIRLTASVWSCAWVDSSASSAESC